MRCTFSFLFSEIIIKMIFYFPVSHEKVLRLVYENRAIIEILILLIRMRLMYLIFHFNY